MVVKVVYLFFIIHERFALGGTIKVDRPRWCFVGNRGRYRQAGLNAHQNIGRFKAGEHLALSAISNFVTPGQVFGG